jgi:hypothetical protein
MTIPLFSSPDGRIMLRRGRRRRWQRPAWGSGVLRPAVLIELGALVALVAGLVAGLVWLLA